MGDNVRTIPTWGLKFIKLSPYSLLWQGMIIITPEPDSVIKVASEHGIESKVIGEVSSKCGIRIRNRGGLILMKPENYTSNYF